MRAKMETTKPALSCLLCLALLQGCGGGGGGSSGGGGDAPPPLPPAEFELQAGNYMDFTYGTQAGGVYAVSMRQASCERGLCCSLTATGGGLEGAANILHEAAPDPATGMARLLLEPPMGGDINLRVSALNQCRFDTPLVASAESASAASQQVSATGNRPHRLLGHSDGQPQRFEQLDVTRVGNRVFLYDTSRRGTSLAADAAISTVKFLPNTASRGEYRLIIHQAADAASLDKGAVDTHGYTQTVHDYFKTILKRDSYDNAGAAMTAVTHRDFPIEPATFCGENVPPGTRYNAFWEPRAQVISFTPGFPQNDPVNNPRRAPETPLSVALDVVAHEWGHAMTNTFTNLIYERESGALNEAFSDWIAAAVEHHFRGEGKEVCIFPGLKIGCAKAVWLIGEDEEPARSMSNPPDYGSVFDLSTRTFIYDGDPDMYQRAKHWRPTDKTSCPTPDICENDYCGVHSNSGVGNKMFYLLSEGGTFNEVTVTGIGVQVAMEIALIAHRDHWSMSSDYAAARRGMVMAAQTYDAANTTSTKAQVENAWKAVGVE